MMTQAKDAALFEAMAYAWLEADRLDHREFDDWLGMWSGDGLYVVPVEPAATDFAAHLNYAYDDAQMRAKRVERMTGGDSVSASPLARTVRSLSRFRLVSDDGSRLELRCMQSLTEYRRERLKTHVADLDFILERHGGSFRILRKVVRLINADHALSGISYIL
ncbi:aromatic-ring-hydroxylating dioxygenase subunit beta [Poseidonocella sp. HB161398]|uniref:aromatic-ring-hydroxylating dioxygenase subunit beta n=1 Tax=Poseidonocella sp. HB161398 TaxID=2320855 RepID=UPI00197F552E|nr:aromatic-ring-hydroxylating dioxygenase subunit beta [Poseidonocella sp. HB161398]